jgi:hypothetical protein
VSKQSSGGGAAVGGGAGVGTGGPSGAAASLGTHDIKLPKDKRRMSIDQASSALKQMGGSLDKSSGKFDLGKKQQTYVVKTPSGTKRMTSREIADVVYKGQR